MSQKRILRTSPATSLRIGSADPRGCSTFHRGRRIGSAAAIALLGIAFIGLPALADASVGTDRGCGSSAVFFSGETVAVRFHVGWIAWFQNWSLTVYDAEDNVVTRRSGTLLPFFSVNRTIFVGLDDGRPRGEWRAVVWSGWWGRDTCRFTVADASLSPPDSPVRFLNKGESHLWQLRTAPGVSYTAVLACDSGNDFDLFLLDRNLNEIQSSIAVGCPDVITFTASDSIYYLRVYAASGSGFYGLQVF